MLARREVGIAIICWILLDLASVACSEIWVGAHGYHFRAGLVGVGKGQMSCWRTLPDPWPRAGSGGILGGVRGLMVEFIALVRWASLEGGRPLGEMLPFARHCGEARIQGTWLAGSLHWLGLPRWRQGSEFIDPRPPPLSPRGADILAY